MAIELLEQEKFYTAREARAYLQISPSTMWRLHRDGQINGIKVGHRWRYTREELHRVGEPVVVEKKQQGAVI